MYYGEIITVTEQNDGQHLHSISLSVKISALW